MTLGHDLLLWLHFTGLFLGGASAFGLPALGAVIDKADGPEKPVLARVVKPLKMIGHVGLALLLLTGVILATTVGAWGEGPAWFYVKLVAVVALVAGIVVAGKTSARAMTGDAAAGAKMPMISAVNTLLGLFVLLAATFAFH